MGGLSIQEEKIKSSIPGLRNGRRSVETPCPLHSQALPHIESQSFAAQPVARQLFWHLEFPYRETINNCHFGIFRPVLSFMFPSSNLGAAFRG
ncbi:MAG: hypothetical protein EB070_09810 [Synechococcaceae bacterium WBA_2_066]|nr:hypothetical protein [Synechococcaceae bacterium WBA_2_066]